MVHHFAAAQRNQEDFPELRRLCFAEDLEAPISRAGSHHRLRSIVTLQDLGWRRQSVQLDLGQAIPLKNRFQRVLLAFVLNFLAKVS